MSYTITRHAEQRMQQRGMRRRDLDMILRFGTVTDDGVILTNRDAAAQIAVYQRRISLLERLKGTAVFTAGNRATSVYRPAKRRVRRMIRSRRSSR